MTVFVAYVPTEGEESSNTEARVYFYLWLAASLVSTFYTLTWDLKMDWGLFDKNAGENTFLREEIVYPQKVSCWKRSLLMVIRKTKGNCVICLHDDAAIDQLLFMIF